MCVNVSPEQVKKDMPKEFDNLVFADVATKYGYKCKGPTDVPSPSAGYSAVVNLMKDTSAKGLAAPVIVKVNDTEAKQHWVVITKFSGDDTVPDLPDFTCVDPWTGTERPLKSATNYDRIFRTVVYYK
jgi:hypothetical protein